MKIGQAFTLFVIVAAGVFAALAVWSIIVKDQVQAQLNSSSTGTTLNTISSLGSLIGQ